ncbi:hypothetical protein PINS_up002882 [Pythium insidiosum]|nr:hypothetical protein PINS_up002882 [Pythium insidiosum]
MRIDAMALPLRKLCGLRAALRLQRQRPHVAAVDCCRSFCASGGDAGGHSKGSMDATTKQQQAPPKKTSAAPGVTQPSATKPIQNFRDVMEALDIMIDEAEKKMVKKYRPNMFAEFKQLNDTDGKVLEGPEELITVDKALKVPSLSVRTLTRTETDVATLCTASSTEAAGKQPTQEGVEATLLLTSFKNFGLNMLPAWRDPFQQAMAGRNVQVLTLNIIEDWYMKLVQASIMRGLESQTPDALRDATLVHFGRCDDFRTTLDLYNSFVGYAHLIDRQGRIRWIAGGPATPKELDRLVQVTNQLLAQQKQADQARRR